LSWRLFVFKSISSKRVIDTAVEEISWLCALNAQ